MGMKCASDKSNILTNFHVAAPHYHPEKGVEQRPAGKVDRGGREQGVPQWRQQACARVIAAQEFAFSNVC